MVTPINVQAERVNQLVKVTGIITSASKPKVRVTCTGTIPDIAGCTMVLLHHMSFHDSWAVQVAFAKDSVPSLYISSAIQGVRDLHVSLACKLQSYNLNKFVSASCECAFLYVSRVRQYVAGL